MTLRSAQIGREYAVAELSTQDRELEQFLFRLGCYTGEPVTVISRRKHSLTVAIKYSRYNMDNQLAEAIFVCDAVSNS